MTARALWAAVLGAILLAGAPAVLNASSDDRVIVRAFHDVLDREPTERELRRYRDLMYDEHWTEGDIRDDLRRRSDYHRHSERRIDDPDRIVRRAYEDILHREPDTEGLRLYRSRIIDTNWTEQDVREALRRSPEYSQRASESADKIVRRAYRDVLGRDPDKNGLYAYRNKVLHQGWDEHDVVEALRRSPEFREKNAMTREQAEAVVRRAYQGVLGREPDPCSRSYVDRVLRDHWSEADVARELRNSEEYRRRQR
jgi:TorA maturation chaperone TorD